MPNSMLGSDTGGSIPVDIMTNDAAYRFWVVQLLTTLKVKMDELSTSKADIEARLRKVESRIWTAAGGASVIGSMGAAALSYLLRNVWH